MELFYVIRFYAYVVEFSYAHELAIVKNHVDDLVMLSRPGGSFCVFIEKLPLARNQVPIAIYHLLTEVKAKRKLSFIIRKLSDIVRNVTKLQRECCCG